MIPRETRDLIKEFARQRDMDEKDMLDMMNFYYRDIVRSCSQWEHLRITIHGLGVMYFKEWMIPPLRWNKDPYKKISAQKKKDWYKNHDGLLRKMDGRLADKTIDDMKYLNPERYKQYMNGKQVDGSMEEQRDDSEGDMEQVSE